jgi:hypothetical protein
MKLGAQRDAILAKDIEASEGWSWATEPMDLSNLLLLEG